MSAQRIRVAIVGGGRTGSPLLSDFLSRPFVEVVAVVDKDPDSPGARKAAAFGVYCTSSVADLVERSDDIDMIIEVSGDPDVKSVLKEAFLESGNHHTIIVHDLVARLIISLAADATDLMPSFHPADDGIGSLASHSSN